MSNQVQVDGRDVEVTDEQVRLFNNMTDLQKRVVLAFLSGMPKAEAYKAGGGQAKAGSSTYVAAHTIFKNYNVNAFVESFDKERISDSIMGKDEMLERLTAMARTKLSDVMEIETRELIDPSTGKVVPAGTIWTLKNMDEMTEGQKAAISELTATKDGIKIKTHATPAIMKQLAELQGLDAAKKVEGELVLHKGLDDFYGGNGNT